MAKTSIEWCDVTWNPVRGCSRVSEGCRNCYAERMAARNLPEMRSPTTGERFAVIGSDGPHWSGKVELIESKLTEPLHWRKPRRVFVNSMSDLFHENLPDDAIDRVFAVMVLCPHLTFQVLTKRPERMRSYFDGLEYSKCLSVDGCWTRIYHASGLMALGESAKWRDWNRNLDAYDSHPHRSACWPLPNVWLGVSVEDQATADARIPLLLQTPAAVRFVSYEPALGPLKLYVPWTYPRDGAEAMGIYGGDRGCIDWLIAGGESGPGARPFDLAWARSARDQCKAAGVPFFMKQLGARPVLSVNDLYRWLAELPCTARKLEDGAYRLLLIDRKGGMMSEWAEDLQIREFPASVR